MMSIIGNFFFGRDAAGRLVEQQQLGLSRQRHRDVEQLAHAAGKLGDAAVAVFAEPEAREQRVGLIHGSGAARGLPERKPVAVAGGGHQHVVEHAQLGVELRDLERSRHAQARDGPRFERGDV